MASRAPVSALILAAGQGKRMKSERIKLLHVLGGAPMVCHVARVAAELRPAVLAAVVGNQGDEVTAALTGQRGLLDAGLKFVTQERQLGTAHAVLQAEALLKSAGGRKGDLLILNGDVPLIRPATLRALLRHHRRQSAAATVLTTMVEDPDGYGRVVRDDEGELVSIVEDRDATAQQRKITEINAGLYCADLSVLFDALRRTGRANAQGEYYLPDLFPILKKQGRRVEAYRHPDAEEVLGVNDRSELSRAGKILYRRRAGELMDSGVTIIDPDCTYIDPSVRVGQDTIIHPLAQLEGSTTIGAGCTIGALSHIIDSTLGDDVLVRDMCVITGSTVGSGVKIGPFAHLRPGTVLDHEVHIGNFVEVKKTRVGRGSKASHLTYLGDATIGEGCNVGAGTITCNYDGVNKNTTTLEDGVFIGSNTALVAPVTVGRGAFVGAGSTITKDVPDGALALGRAKQNNIEGWARRRQRDQEPKRARKKRGKV
jgi:bifunctional UDP-N-acetylglucosamine pyrophosphorylase / glucosamine-1-phosphate N-acetyltransferase